MIKARLTSIQPNIFRKGNIWMGRGQTGSDSLMPLQHTQASGSITSSKKKKKEKHGCSYATGPLMKRL